MARFYYFLLLVLLSTQLASCKHGNQSLIESAPLISVNYVDDLGRTVALPSPPSRIISLSPSVTETFYAIGAEAKLIGRSQICQFPGDALELPAIQSFPVINLRQIQEINPDLVIVSSEVHQPAIVEMFETAGVPVFYLKSYTFEDNYRNMATIGEIANAESGAKHLIDSLQSIEQKIIAATEGQILYPTLAILQVDTAVVVAGGGCLLNEMIVKAGGKNIYGSKPIDFVEAQEEEIIQAAPEFVILATDDEQLYSQFASKFPAAHLNMPASQLKQIFMLDPQLVRRGGPRMIEGLATLTRTLHSRINVSEFFEAPAQ